MFDKRAQVWVETVVYTLIGLTIMGIMIGVATPKIKQMTDKAIIEQTISAMKELNDKIYITQSAVGQSRKIDFKIKKGSFVIDASENKIYFLIEGTTLKYSEPGQEIPQGSMTILTQENGDNYDVYMTLAYDLDITYDGGQEKKVLTQAPTSYQLLIENKGGGVLDIRLI